MIGVMTFLRLPGANRLKSHDREFGSMNKCLKGVGI
jgi:hypothetical protein